MLASFHKNWLPNGGSLLLLRLLKKTMTTKEKFGAYYGNIIRPTFPQSENLADLIVFLRYHSLSTAWMLTAIHWQYLIQCFKEISALDASLGKDLTPISAIKGSLGQLDSENHNFMEIWECPCSCSKTKMDLVRIWAWEVWEECPNPNIWTSRGIECR